MEKTILLIGAIAILVLISGCSQSVVDPVVCTMDAKMCPDGSFVARNPELNCEFNPCPEIDDPSEEIIFCPEDTMECPDGSWVIRNPELNCEFNSCPGDDGEAVFCAQDVFECPDGSFVPRNPELDCEFNPCP